MMVFTVVPQREKTVHGIKLYRIECHHNGEKRTIARSIMGEGTANGLRRQFEEAYNAGRDNGWRDCAQLVAEHLDALKARLSTPEPVSAFLKSFVQAAVAKKGVSVPSPKARRRVLPKAARSIGVKNG